jgi:hypothetical protein
MAQLMPPNKTGVTMGHIQLIVKDVPAQTCFWVDMMGGTVVMNDKLSEIEFPGVYILLRRGDASGPSAGSVVKRREPPNTRTDPNAAMIGRGDLNVRQPSPLLGGDSGGT